MSEQEEFERERELFHRACLLDREEQDGFLERVCGEDHRLRERLEALLEAEANPVLDPAITAGEDSQERSPQTIKGYRLIRKIGDGGMGDVWEAQQEEPIQRRVALKLIRLGMDTESVVRRFETERQTLALMEHPAIAKVYDAGSTDQGRPFFAMEFVEGVPITVYCDTHRLSVKDRLGLFADVCRGAQHAHQKGIIHRDLKPANILVTENEGRPLPKIIDFGIAKATEHRLTEESVFTELGQWIGTPEYMSPEQATISNQDIDTRTDVYSLGAVLYELLVGAQPLSRRELRSAGFEEMRRRIREEEPLRPSTRVRTSNATETMIASDRQTSSNELVRTLEGDLDWITMTALEKDRERRYGSPLDMLADIDRHLHDEAVLARPPSGLYRARKFIRRHRTGVLATAFSVVALIVGLALATVGFVRAKKSERMAIEQAESAQRVSGVLESIFNTMNPGSQAGQFISPQEILQHGSRTISDSLRDQPVVRARLMSTMGNVATNLGYFEMADTFLAHALAAQRQALGNDHPDVARTLFTMGWQAYWLGDYDRSLAHFSEASSILEEAPADRLGLNATTAMGLLMSLNGDEDGAREVLDQVLKISRSSFGPNDTLVSDVLLFSGNLHFNAGDREVAGREWEEAVSIRRAAYGPDHQQYAFAITNLARYLRASKRLDESAELLSRAIEIFERTYGPDHPALAHTLAARGSTLRAMEDFDDSVVHFQRAVAIIEEQFDPDHPDLSWIKRGLTRTYLRNDDFEAAVTTAREALRTSRTVWGETHLETARNLSLLGFAEYRLERYPDAREAFQASLEIRRESLDPSHPGVAITWYNLACLSALEGDTEQALGELRRALDAGFSNPVIFDDPDLRSLRGLTEFEEMVGEARRRQTE
jgi:serine/threonine protein kinase/tetratricopeptide (TPR) repeat protein